MPHSGNNHCLVLGPEAFEITRRQIGKRYPLAVSIGEKEAYFGGVVRTNQIIYSVLWIDASDTLGQLWPAHNIIACWLRFRPLNGQLKCFSTAPRLCVLLGFCDDSISYNRSVAS